MWIDVSPPVIERDICRCLAYFNQYRLTNKGKDSTQKYAGMYEA
jgi:hypothetical protein